MSSNTHRSTHPPLIWVRMKTFPNFSWRATHTLKHKHRHTHIGQQHRFLSVCKFLSEVRVFSFQSIKEFEKCSPGQNLKHGDCGPGHGGHIGRYGQPGRTPHSRVRAPFFLQRLIHNPKKGGYRSCVGAQCGRKVADISKAWRVTTAPEVECYRLDKGVASMASHTQELF